MRIFMHKKELETDYCQRCDRLCGPACQAEVDRERMMLSLFRSGMRMA